LEGPCSEVSDDVLRPVAAVECRGRKARTAWTVAEHCWSKPSLPGIEWIDAGDPVISPDPTMNAVDHLYPYQEIDGTRRFLSRFGDANKLVIRWCCCHATSEPMPLSGGPWLTWTVERNEAEKIELGRLGAGS
jgi:hypothetical protein